eukprot:Pgem_evm1s8241
MKFTLIILSTIAGTLVTSMPFDTEDQNLIKPININTRSNPYENKNYIKIIKPFQWTPYVSESNPYSINDYDSIVTDNIDDDDTYSTNARNIISSWVEFNSNGNGKYVLLDEQKLQSFFSSLSNNEHQIERRRRGTGYRGISAKHLRRTGKHPGKVLGGMILGLGSMYQATPNRNEQKPDLSKNQLWHLEMQRKAREERYAKHYSLMKQLEKVEIPIVGLKLLETTYENSRREQVPISKSSEYPYSTVGFLRSTAPNLRSTYACTGTLIAKNVVLTAAHCIIDEST